MYRYDINNGNKFGTLEELLKTDGLSNIKLDIQYVRLF